LKQFQRFISHVITVSEIILQVKWNTGIISKLFQNIFCFTRNHGINVVYM